MTILTWTVSTHNHFHSKRLHTITQMNDNINMDSVYTQSLPLKKTTYYHTNE